MIKLSKFGMRIAICASLALSSAAGSVWAQSADRDQVKEMAVEIKDLMEKLRTRTEALPPLLEKLEQGLENINKAQEHVAGLIANLEEATTHMEDESAFDLAIDNYKGETLDLIAEAKASNNDVIKRAIPGLQKTLAGLEKDDQDRSTTVAEARNLIRTLEKNDEALVFFIKANQVQLAAESIRENIGKFSEIVKNGSALAESLLEGVTQ